ncbi:diaminopimelate epimerase [Desulfobulbus propionicus DSM 2032]|uniref:Diaminopimelate epimerase n=1 Tax=Desulfobulbus propionicus (strain ATCC 33891 / DSM 2032 / VKM B-1956 / 1pr3) TaxID=577650 RepID=A0A7U3YJT7_DESPD|nr:diaminopimelate epimerase [Desulfobulbus propionicus]ADW16701.1 diaminopimelate epimerase [Desulfobulbus propionicus DSM 2032]
MNSITLPIPFWKMSGAGNDFIIIDHRKPLIPQERMAEFARLVCRRKFSVGADGLFLIEPSTRADFKWRFFNADGSEAEMCGNGARCVARFAYMHGIAAARMRFETLAGIVEATVADTTATIKMTSPHSFRFDRQIEVGGQLFMVHSVDTGVPHAVIFVDDIDEVDMVGLGRQLRHHPVFAPMGTNVNFVGRTGDGFRIRTYERGVEDETMACGTGVVAGALIAAVKGYADSPVAMVTSGGIALTVQFSGKKGTDVDQVLLKGPAHLIYRGELTSESLIA